mmetsp:Transcript_3949/g.8520  ORF Transcript_3949/g.8520 Transcript_3949/m.8520 type:complete len:258 (+) Transcript_3949:2026-2799(+)
MARLLSMARATDSSPFGEASMCSSCRLYSSRLRGLRMTSSASSLSKIPSVAAAASSTACSRPSTAMMSALRAPAVESHVTGSSSPCGSGTTKKEGLWKLRVGYMSEGPPSSNAMLSSSVEDAGAGLSTLDFSPSPSCCCCDGACSVAGMGAMDVLFEPRPYHQLKKPLDVRGRLCMGDGSDASDDGRCEGAPLSEVATLLPDPLGRVSEKLCLVAAGAFCRDASMLTSFSPSACLGSALLLERERNEPKMRADQDLF